MYNKGKDNKKDKVVAYQRAIQYYYKDKKCSKEEYYEASKVEIKRNNIEFDISNKKFVNDSVFLSLVYNYDVPDGYELQFCIDTQNNYQKYIEHIKITKNCTVYGRLYNNANDDVYITNSYEIKNIDKDASTFEIKIIKFDLKDLNIALTDVKAVGSGADLFRYKINDEIWSDLADQGNYRLEDIDTNGEIKIEVEAKDKVGNVSSKSILKNQIVTSKFVLSNAKEKVATIGGRGFYKENDEPTVACVAKVGGYWGVFFVGGTEEAVECRTDYSNTITPCRGWLMYNDEKYFYSNWKEWMPTRDVVSNLNVLSVSYTYDEGNKLAKDLYYNE